jgi:hypothetical protein
MDSKKPYSEWTKKELVDFVDHFAAMMADVFKRSDTDSESNRGFRYKAEPTRPPQHMIDSLSTLTDAQLDSRLDMLLEEASTVMWIRDNRKASFRRAH